jgi:hypothetical protein
MNVKKGNFSQRADAISQAGNMLDSIVKVIAGGQSREMRQVEIVKKGFTSSANRMTDQVKIAK